MTLEDVNQSLSSKELYFPSKQQMEDVCANCNASACATNGGAGVVMLKKCNACLLVKYCSVDCQKAHRKLHKKACKKRAAELKDERLYSQGHERPEGDFCPICTLPVPMPTDQHSTFNACCTKMVCNGCVVAAIKRGMYATFPFCRNPMPEDSAEILALVQKRIDTGDADAMEFLAGKYLHGQCGLKRDVQRAFELLAEAAELGSIKAHHHLGVFYKRGHNVERDETRAVGHWEHAAMKGNVMSRHCLGFVEANKGNSQLALKHFLISAKMGYKESLDAVKVIFTHGDATKAQYAEALKGYQDAVEETKSHQREEAKDFYWSIETKGLL